MKSREFTKLYDYSIKECEFGVNIPIGNLVVYSYEDRKIYPYNPNVNYIDIVGFSCGKNRITQSGQIYIDDCDFIPELPVYPSPEKIGEFVQSPETDGYKSVVDGEIYYNECINSKLYPIGYAVDKHILGIHIGYGT